MQVSTRSSDVLLEAPNERSDTAVVSRRGAILPSVSAPEQTQQSQFAGLTSKEAQRRLEQYGKNETSTKRAHSPWVDLLLLLSNPLAIVLLVASVISAVIGQKIDAFIIILLILIGAGIDFVQTYRSRIVIERLRASVATLGSVERDDKWLDLPRAELVPGDLIRLCAGDLIPRCAPSQLTRSLRSTGNIDR